MGLEEGFPYRILDNVHGFIQYSETERKIIESQLFKRLQSIKQQSIANWVFPGSEHTRFTHSLGVMFLSDKIAHRLNVLDSKELKTVRLAGLLHDIGHYPLSHVGEYPYKESMTDFPDTNYCCRINEQIKHRIDTYSAKTKSSFMEPSNGNHHERIGAQIVLYNKEIRSLIESECGEEAPQIIEDMIVGNVQRQLCEHEDLMVQILHAELDADGIDYLMRDASFSGTSFGSFELDQLIACMEVGNYNGKNILCITPKGIAAADQYLINKFFSYSQVVFNKHISVTEWMAEQIVDWMQKNKAYFPAANELASWVKSPETNQKYLNFTDNYFWAVLQNLLDNPLCYTEPNFISHFCRELLHHNELEYEKGSEVRLIDRDDNTIRMTLQNSFTYQQLNTWKDRIAILSSRTMSKHSPEKEFETAIQEEVNSPDSKAEETSIDRADIPEMRTRRLMDGICVRDEDELHLLCDDSRSLMRTLYNQQLVVLRAFKCPI